MKGPAFFMIANSKCYLVVVKCLPPTFSVIQSSDESITKINIPNFYFLNTIMISYKTKFGNGFIICVQSVVSIAS